MYSDPTADDLGSMDDADDPGASSEAPSVAAVGDIPEERDVAPAEDSSAPAEHDDPAEPLTADIPAVVRTPTPLFSFKSEMARAMQVVADHERERIDAGVGEQETAQVEKIHLRAAAESAQLSKHADEDVSLIDAWYDHEVQRIRAEADRRIDDRRAGLEQAITHHGSLIDAEIQSVHDAVERYRAALTAFFSRLAEEQDPSVIARLAGTLPDIPDLDAARAEARATAMRALEQDVTVEMPVQPVEMPVQPVEMPVQPVEMPTQDATIGAGPVELERELVPVMDPDLVRERVSILSGMTMPDATLAEATPAEATLSAAESDAEAEAAATVGDETKMSEETEETVAAPVRASIWSSWKGNSEGQ